MLLLLLLLLLEFLFVCVVSCFVVRMRLQQIAASYIFERVMLWGCGLFPLLLLLRLVLLLLLLLLLLQAAGSQ